MASPTDGNCKPRPRALLWRLRRLPELSQSCRRRDRDKYRQRSSRSSARDTARSYRGPTVGMTQSQTLDWWTGENKYLGDQINCQLSDSMDIGSLEANSKYFLQSVCLHVNSSHCFCSAHPIAWLGFVYLPTFCHIPCIMREKVGIQRLCKQIKMQEMSVHGRRQGRQKREIHNMKSVECHQFYSV